MKTLLFISISLLLTGHQYVPVKNIPVQALFFTTDNLGNIYVINTVHEFFKYDSNGNLLASYSDKNLGGLEFVDATNPLQLLLFYPNFSQIGYLDKTLSKKGAAIPLEHYGLEQVSLVTSSFDNGFWCYDARDLQLKKYDTNFNLIQQSGNLNQLTGKEIDPNFLYEYNHWVYLNNPKEGILIFDVYGTFYRIIPIKGITSFQVIADEILYYKENTLKRFNLKTLEEKNILLPSIEKSHIRNARIEKQKLYLLSDDYLRIYSF